MYPWANPSTSRPAWLARPPNPPGNCRWIFYSGGARAILIYVKHMPQSEFAIRLAKLRIAEIYSITEISNSPDGRLTFMLFRSLWQHSHWVILLSSANVYLNISFLSFASMPDEQQQLCHFNIPAYELFSIIFRSRTRIASGRNLDSEIR